MGLDMYLTGRKSYGYMASKNEVLKEDGFPVREKVLEIGYWRKHPNLHGYIVENFAGGVDECQEIFLTPGDIADIIKAVEEDRLPFTEGFFFGRSATPDMGEDYIIEKTETLDTFNIALEWLSKEVEHDGIYCVVVYRASW